MNSVAAVWEGGRHVSRASRIHGRDARQRDQSGLANEAYLVLRNRIVDGELLVGQRLSRRQIATDVGISALKPRSAWAVATASAVYSEIGRELARRSYAVDVGRAHVSRSRKLYLAARSGLGLLKRTPSRSARPALRLEHPLRFPHDILPL